MPTGRKQDSNTPLTRSEKRRLGRALLDLTLYLGTSEGNDMIERLEQVTARIHNRAKLDRLESLTPQEARALKFIQAQLTKGRSPTIRQVGEAVGLRSSRSGFRMMQSLLCKGVLKRDNQGFLIQLVD